MPSGGQFSRAADTTDSGRVFGNVVYAAHDDWVDIALIEVTAVTATSGRVAAWGGPTRLYSGVMPAPSTLHIYGQGVAVHSVQPARDLLVASPQANAFTLTTLGPIVFGDSGAPILTEDGAAVGVMVAITADTVGNARVGRLDYALKRLRMRLALPLQLSTSR